jgi:hypothetical protein
MTEAQLMYLGYRSDGTKKPAAEQAKYVGEPCQKERDLHDFVLAQCKHRGWYAIHARMDMPTTVAVGAPDFVIVANNGRTIYIECKTGVGKLSQGQMVMVTWLMHLGHTLHICRSEGDVLAAFKEPKP